MAALNVGIVCKTNSIVTGLEFREGESFVLLVDGQQMPLKVVPDSRVASQGITYDLYGSIPSPALLSGSYFVSMEQMEELKKARTIEFKVYTTNPYWNTEAVMTEEMTNRLRQWKYGASLL